MIVEILLLLAALAAAFYFYMTKKFGQWRDMGIPHSKPSFPFGSPVAWTVMKRKAAQFDVALDYYNENRAHRVYGDYFFRVPFVVVNDPEIIKAVMVKDFANFVDRTSGASPLREGGQTDRIWARQLTSLTGDSWKKVRATFSPVFTSGKMRGMMAAVRMVCGQLTERLQEECAADAEFDVKEVFTRYTIGSIVSCTFGADAKAFQKGEADSELYKHATTIIRTVGSADSPEL